MGTKTEREREMRARERPSRRWRRRNSVVLLPSQNWLAFLSEKKGRRKKEKWTIFFARCA
jgi:hypothetical protein